MSVRRILRAVLPLATSVALLAVGCVDPGTDEFEPVDREVEGAAPPVDEPEPERRPPPPAEPPARGRRFTAPGECQDPANWRRVERVHEVVEGSVHELVTCGGAQLGVINTLAARVLLSNPQFFDPETLDDLGALMSLFGVGDEVPFTADEAGDWHMPINDQSDFRIRFYPRAGADAPIVGDVFDLALYLVDARIETSHSWPEMLADLELINTYTLTWSALGPQGALMFPEGEPADRTAVLRLSLLDLAYLLGWGSGERPDFGPFERLGDLGIDSDVNLVDTRAGIDVAYRFHGIRGVLTDLASDGAVAFDFLGLSASDGVVAFEGDAGELTYLRQGILAGTLSYDVTDDQGETRWTVVDDFGEGAAYPEPRVRCFDPEPESPLGR